MSLRSIPEGTEHFKTRKQDSLTGDFVEIFLLLRLNNIGEFFSAAY